MSTSIFCNFCGIYNSGENGSGALDDICWTLTSPFLYDGEQLDAESVWLRVDTDFGLTHFTSKFSICTLSCYSIFVEKSFATTASPVLRYTSAAIFYHQGTCG